MFAISRVWATLTHLHTHASLTGVTATQHHDNANDHTRLHSTTDVLDHSFPGGTTTFLRGDGTYAVPATGATGDLVITQQTLTANLSVLDGTNAITAGHLNLGSYNITLNGSAKLFVL